MSEMWFLGGRNSACVEHKCDRGVIIYTKNEDHPPELI